MKNVSRVDEFENVTGIINLYQLLINLYNFEISLEISFEKRTWNGTSYPRFAVHILNFCTVCPLLSFWMFPSLSPAISCLALHYFEHSFHSYLSSYLSLSWGENRPLQFSFVVNGVCKYCVLKNHTE